METGQFLKELKIKEGSLLVKGGGKASSWKKLWVVLDAGGFLYFFKDKEIRDQTLDSKKDGDPLHLSKAFEVAVKPSKKHAFCFRLENTKKSKKIQFSTESEEERRSWMKWINNLIHLEENKIFGIELVSTCTHSMPVPTVVRATIDRLHSEVDVPGIMRLSGSKNQIDALVKRYDAGDNVDLKDVDAHVVSGLLKTFLRSLPNPVCPFESYSKFVNASVNPQALSAVVREIPFPHQVVLKLLMRLLKKISQHERVNQMGVKNLAIVFAPTLLHDQNETTNAMNSELVNLIVETLIVNEGDIFGSIPDPESNGENSNSTKSSDQEPNSPQPGTNAKISFSKGAKPKSSPKRANAPKMPKKSVSAKKIKKPIAKAQVQVAGFDLDDWKEYQTDEGRPYYYNVKTSLTTWEKPENISNPNSPQMSSPVSTVIEVENIQSPKKQPMPPPFAKHTKSVSNNRDDNLQSRLQNFEQRLKALEQGQEETQKLLKMILQKLELNPK